MRLHLITLLLGLAVTAGAQNNGTGLVDAVTDDVCRCIAETDLSGMSRQDIEMTVGMCLLGSLNEREGAMEQLNLDLTDEAALNAFGEQIGMNMATRCPRTLLQFANKLDGNTSAESGPLTEDTAAAGDDRHSRRLTGRLRGVEGDRFATVLLETESGDRIQLLWLDEFPGARSLADGRMIGRRVAITCVPENWYSPAEGRYAERLRITGLKVID